MLLSKTNELLNEMDNLDNFKELANDSQGFITRSQQLKNIDNILIGIVDVILLFKSQGFNVDIVSIFNDFINSFSILKEKWNKDKKSLLDSNAFLRNNNLSSIVNEINNDLTNKWEEYIEENKPSLNMEQLNILENIPDLANMVNTLKIKLIEINELKDNLPNDDNKFKLVIETSKDMNKLWNELSSQNIPNEAMNFLKKAGSHEGIDLSEVTPGILLWLQEHKLTHLCQVRFMK
ncbi:MAG: hypothetical protein DRG78_09265 [Epsilonproteobacteria bacterium]|nr:MAG: hypothetical protein DRG78_09265 [Campylobacterota bacterium]